MKRIFKSKAHFLVYLRTNYSPEEIVAFAHLVNQDPIYDHEVDVSVGYPEILIELKTVDQAVLESALEDLDEYLNSLESEDESQIDEDTEPVDDEIEEDEYDDESDNDSDLEQEEDLG